MEIKVKRSDNVIRVLFKNNTKTCFSATGIKIGETPIFKDSSSKTMEVLKVAQNETKIENIAKAHKAEIILACSNQFVKKVIRLTEEYQVDVGLFISEKREILHYIVLSYMEDESDNLITLLLIAYDD